MGAANALRAYRTYGAAVGNQSLRVLVYMALVSRDRDSEPWCSIGHEGISEFALSRPLPSYDTTKLRKQALRIVERAMTELADAGAIRTIKRATYSRHGVTPARYRLYLDKPCFDARPDRSTRHKTTGGIAVTNRREAEATTRQKMTHHPSENDAPPVSFRRTKEEEETRGAINTGVLQSTRGVEGTTAAAAGPVENQMSAIEAAAWAAVGRNTT